MSVEKGSSKTDTLVKVVLVFFISLLSFSVGTFVGKQVSDSDHRRMALEGEYKTDRQVASVEADSGDKISEKEVENLTEEFVNKEKVVAGNEDSEEAPAEKIEKSEKPEKSEPSGYKTYAREKVAEKGHGARRAEASAAEPSHEVAQESGHEAAPTKKSSASHEAHDATNAVAEKVAHGEAPTDGAKEVRKPASTLPSVANSAVGKYTIQVDSYTSENDAKTRAADLKGKGWSSFYFPAEIGGKTWYRVSVGLFSNTKSAKEFLAQFMKESNTKSAIVQRIVQ